MIEKLHTACLGVKLTLENLPKTVERLEQKRKLHESCAQVMLEVKMLEKQQQLILERFKDNGELVEEVRQGMEHNLAVAKKNIALITSSANKD